MNGHKCFKENTLHKILRYLAPLLLVGLAPVATASSDPNNDLTATVLRVNDDGVTYHDVFNAIKPETRVQMQSWAAEMHPLEFSARTRAILGEATTDNIRRLLMYQFAKRDLEKMDNFQDIINKAKADRRRDFIAQYEGNEAKARMELAQKGTSIDKVLSDFERSFIVNSYWEKRFPRDVKITRQQVLQYYQTHIVDAFTQKASLQFQLIDIHAEKFPTPAEAQQAAQQALTRVQKGEDFGAVAKECSHDFNKDNGGLWRPMDPASLQEKYQPVVKALQSLDPGQTTGLIPGEGRFFIAKLVQRADARAVPFNEAQLDIRGILYEQLQQKQAATIGKQMLEEALIGAIDRFVEETALALYNHLKLNAAAPAVKEDHPS